MSDGLYLSLKVVNKSVFPYEVVIGQYFMMEQSASHPQNHCVPFLDVLQVPDESDKEIIVMPLLLDFTRPRFDTFGEVVECLRQLFEVSATTPDFDIPPVIYYRACCSCTTTMWPTGRWRDITVQGFILIIRQ